MQFFLIALTTGLNCTRLRLEQLLAYCRAIFFQIALKSMWLPIQICSDVFLLENKLRLTLQNLNDTLKHFLFCSFYHTYLFTILDYPRRTYFNSLQESESQFIQPGTISEQDPLNIILNLSKTVEKPMLLIQNLFLKPLTIKKERAAFLFLTETLQLYPYSRLHKVGVF